MLQLGVLLSTAVGLALLSCWQLQAAFCRGSDGCWARPSLWVVSTAGLLLLCGTFVARTTSSAALILRFSCACLDDGNNAFGLSIIVFGQVVGVPCKREITDGQRWSKQNSAVQGGTGGKGGGGEVRVRRQAHQSM